jgi:hypothetical protein
MSSEPKPHFQPPSRDELERLLRRLPAPPVPPGLEAKLLAQTPSAGSVRQPTKRTRWWIAAAGLGAAAAAVIVGLVLLREPTAAPPPPANSTASRLSAMSPADIRRAIEREAAAARLVASAEMLAQDPCGQKEALKMFSYVRQEYGDTAAAGKIPAAGTPSKGDAL